MRISGLRVALVLSFMVSASSAEAFCGFYVSGAGADLYNNATQVVLMRQGTRTVLSMQNSYQGPPEKFAMVVPVPQVLQKENVKILEDEVFAKIDKLAAPRLVEYWEKDPCYVEPQVDYASMPMKSGGGVRRRAGALGVKIEAQFKVGEYEIVVLSANDSAGLDTWLRQEKYQIPKGAEPYLKPYVEAGSKFFVAKVDTSKVKFVDGRAKLSPLRFHYDSNEFSLPIRLGLINSGGTQDLIVHVLAQGQRYEVANYPNVTIPTNLEVDDSTKQRFGEFYAALFDRTIERKSGAVVTEYSWDSGTCDPCPTPPLTHQDLMTLGLDVVGTKGAGQGPPSRPGRFRRMPRTSMVLTRLHARYQKDAVGEDLIFKAAPPIVGGREHVVSNGKLEEGAKPGSVNNFQGRYIIRHPWEGPIKCEKPVRGRWGGPPSGQSGSTQPQAATDLAFAPRGKARLATFVKADIPEIGYTRASDDEEPAAEEKAPEPSGPGTTESRRKKNGCRLAGSDTGSAWLVLLGLALVARRRRR